MKNLSIIYCMVAGLMMGTTRGYAQQATKDSTLKSTTIEIIQSYQPEIKTTPKVVLQPELPTQAQNAPAQQYVIPNFPLSINYHANPLVPLRLPIDSITALPYQNYLKVGVGNFKTLMIDAGIGQFQGENYESAFHLYHLSQSGNQLRQQALAKSGFDALGTLHTSTKKWTAHIDVLRNRYHYYGYNQAVDTFSDDSVRQTYFGVHAGLVLENKPLTPQDLHYSIDAKVGYYQNALSSKENSFSLKVPVAKGLSQNIALLALLDANITQYNHYRKVQNNTLGIGAGIKYHTEEVTAKAMFQPTLGQNSKWLLLPDIQVAYHPTKTNLRLSAGAKGEILRNTFEELSTKNPFVADTLTTLQTNAMSIYAKAATSLLKNFSVSAGVAWLQYKMLPMYVNSYTEAHKFSMVYDSLVQGFQISLGVKYQFAEKFRLGIANEIYRFQKSTYQKVWHQPGIVLKADAAYRLQKHFSITAYASVLNEIFAPNASLPSGYGRLPGVFDLGVGGEYTLVDRLNVFINVNNLFNRQNYRWNGYEELGINLTGGLRVRF